MGLYFTSINSGSNGNCYYVGNEEEAILVDVGLSSREVEKRINRLGLSIAKIKAIFISHEHSDHIKGLRIFAKKYRLPVYISTDTLISSRLTLEEELIYPLSHLETIQIGDLSICAFSKHHDAADPYSFSISCKGFQVGVFTDIGQVCDRLIEQFKNCHAAFLETNYDTNLLENGRYPYFLKKRITGGKGHLSNSEALELFNTHKPVFMTHLLLSHLSRDNNRPDLVEKLFQETAGNVHVKVASRDEESLLYYVGNTPKKENIIPMEKNLFSI
ncbi:MBL fold metallo-hydrolase [Pedobacter sp. MW01-1-1]|uniref:MBL fold metallo-hydrolase n=1 Tax=Pedobacter sp. MW01-1-1 TaxID=3383027 RepID=UPI003FEDDE62